MTTQTNNNRKAIHDLEALAHKENDPMRLECLATSVERLGGDAGWIWTKAGMKRADKLAVQAARAQA